MSIINLLVEGPTDEVLGTKLLSSTGHTLGVCFPKRGIGYIRVRIGLYNQSALGVACLCLVDQSDTSFSCPPDLLRNWLPNRNEQMVLRVAVTALEGWLLADYQGIAGFLGVPVDWIPTNPEQIEHPKLHIVNLARRSRHARIRDGRVPDVGSTARVGRIYVTEIMRFIRDEWDLQAARKNSSSLSRCMDRLEGFGFTF
jgi:hypothetical protein